MWDSLCSDEFEIFWLVHDLKIWQMRGKKVLVLDPLLSGPLALIAQTSFLKVFFTKQEYILFLLFPTQVLDFP